MNICNSIFSYYVGDSKTLVFKALYAQSLAPLDLTSCTEIAVNLPNADGTFTQLLLTDGDVVVSSPAVLGEASCFITATLWADPNVGVAQDLVITFTISGNPITVNYQGALSVFQV